MYDDHIGGQPSATLRTILAAQAPQILQTPTTTTTTADTRPTLTNSSSQATSIPITSHNVDELETQQQHVQPQPATIADNVLNAMFDENTLLIAFCTTSTTYAESPSSHYVDPFDTFILNQSPCGNFTNQSNYVLKILKKYGMETYDPVRTSMEIKDKLNLDQNGTLVDATKYRSMAKPTEKHLKEVKRIFRYLWGTVNKSILQNRRDLPRNTSLDRVEVLCMIEKRSKVRMGIMPTEAELALEQSQQGVSYEVSNQTDLENFTKDFSVNTTLFLIQLESVCICIFDLLDGVPELMHVYFRYFSSDQEYRIA
ncbi:uncharacterized mitochondrial protein-like protein [Tanacetum coccineum]|uniref:Uncharacterized mitochondrial protein-like protein n=1 Tax=Tanacetum coccineum TaxID=301880 RepID=A0ABQ5BKD7_9ASTR